jgi:L-ascorbate metabolism protein UlaG (beta-lactamase superfamily)
LVTLTYIAHSAFHLDDGTHTVLVDPFISGNPAATMTAEDFSPQTILLTHAHNDHVGDTVAIAKRTDAKVIATHELSIWLTQQGVEEVDGGNHGGTVRFEGGSVKFVPAWHTSSYRDGDNLVAPGVPAGLIVRFGGKTIYFAGDTCLFSDMKLIGEEGLDVAIIPIGDHFTMGPEDAVRSVTFLEPKLVIPCHFNTFPQIQQDAMAFKEQVESRTTAQCKPLEPGDSIDLP